jgi:hypothetical protein
MLRLVIGSVSQFLSLELVHGTPVMGLSVSSFLSKGKRKKKRQNPHDRGSSFNLWYMFLRPRSGLSFWCLKEYEKRHDASSSC